MDSSLLEIGFKMSVALGAVLLTFGGAVMIAKKFFGKSMSTFSKKDSALTRAKLQVEGTRMLGQGKNLHLVRFGDKVLLLGATNNQISLISELDLENEESELNFQSTLELNHVNTKEKNLKDQIGNRLREIARI